MIFLIRFVMSACLYIFIGNANIWFNPLGNILLVFGSRFFLIFSPLFYKTCRKYAITNALLLSSVSVMLLCFNKDLYIILGILFLGIGMSVSGYLIRYEAAETISGAANNKIAINAGSLVAGVILLFTFSKNLFFIITAIILLFVALLSWIKHKKDTVVKKLPIVHKVSKRRWFGWALIGITIGIKLYSVFSVLPQYIILHSGRLPSWYGVLVFINSGIIVLLQKPIIYKVGKFQKDNKALKFTLFAICLGMILISFPKLFHIDVFWGAFVWILMLSIIECIVSYLDMHGARDGCLFIKELSIGLGGGICVLLTRCIPPAFSGILLGFVGIISITTAMILLYGDFKSST